MLVAHLQEGMEAIHLYSGRTICRCAQCASCQRLRGCSSSGAWLPESSAGEADMLGSFQCSADIVTHCGLHHEDFFDRTLAVYRPPIALCWHK